jgi:hypothetical protein
MSDDGDRSALARRGGGVLRAIGRLPEAFTRAGLTPVGVGILVCAVAAPFVGLRAAQWAGRADDAARNSLQTLALREDRFSRALAVVNQDVRIFGQYAELSNGVSVLYRQAERLRKDRPATALRLFRQAQARRSLAAGLRQSMRTTGLRTHEDEPPRFAFAAALAGLLARDAELQRVQGAEDQRKAERARARGIHLTGVTLVWGAGLVFFTLTHVVRGKTRQRRIFGTAGLVAVLAAATLPFTGPTW